MRTLRAVCLKRPAARLGATQPTLGFGVGIFGKAALTAVGTKVVSDAGLLGPCLLGENRMHRDVDRVAELRARVVPLAGASRPAEAHVPKVTTFGQAAALMALRLDDSRAGQSNSRIWRWVATNPKASFAEAQAALPSENRSQLEQERRYCLRCLKILGDLAPASEEGLISASERAEQAGEFEVVSEIDARERTLTNIVRRRGQPKFRKALLNAYKGMCAVTGCAVPEVLEAAHVRWYAGEHTNVVTNGLLLRSDVHALFDLGKISIDPTTLLIQVSPTLKGTEYEYLDGKRLRNPSPQALCPTPASLEWHYQNIRSW